MKRVLAILLAAGFAGFASAGAAEPREAAHPVTVVVGSATNAYNLAAVADADGVKGAKAYIDAYADNVQNDADFRANEAKALGTIRTENRFCITDILRKIDARAFALKDRMRPYNDGDIDISRRAAVCSGVAFAAQRNCLSVIDTGRNLHIDLMLLADISRTTARFARLMNDFTLAAASRALAD